MENLRLTPSSSRKSRLVTACIFVALLSALILLPPVAAVKSSLRSSAHLSATTTNSNNDIDSLVLLRKRQVPIAPPPYRRLKKIKKSVLDEEEEEHDDPNEEEEEYDHDDEDTDTTVPDDDMDDVGDDDSDSSPSTSSITTKTPTQWPTFSEPSLSPSPSPPPYLSSTPSSTNDTTTTTDNDNGGNVDDDDLGGDSSTDVTTPQQQLISLPLLPYTMSVTSSSSSKELVQAMESVLLSGLSLAFRNVVRVDLEGKVLDDDDDRRRMMISEEKGTKGLQQQQQRTRSLLFTRLLIPAKDEQSSATTGGEDNNNSSSSSNTLVMEFVGDAVFDSKESDQSDVPSLTTLQAAQRALLLNTTALEQDLEAALLQNSGATDDDVILQVNYVNVSDAGGGTNTIEDDNTDRSPGDNEEITNTDYSNNADTKNNTTVVAVAVTASSMALVIAAGLLVFHRKRRRQLEAMDSNNSSNSIHSSAVPSDETSSSAAPAASHTSSLTYPSAFHLCAKKQQQSAREDDRKKQPRFEGHASSPPPKTAKTKDENRRSERKAASVPSDISVSSSEDSTTEEEEHVNNRTNCMLPSGTGGNNNSGQRQSRTTKRRSSRRRRRRRGNSAGSHHSMSSCGNCTLTSVLEEEAEEVVVEAQDEQIELYSPPDPPEEGRPEVPSSPDPPSTNMIQAMMTISLAKAAAQRSASPISRETNVDVEESVEVSPETTPNMSWGERVRSSVAEPAVFIYALADALTQSQQKTNGKASTPDMPKTPTRKSQWHSPQGKGGDNSGGGSGEPSLEAPTSPYDEQETDLCDACVVSCSPTSPPDNDPVLGRANALFTPYSTANANPQNQEDDGNVTDDQSSGSSTAGDRLVKSIFKTRYFSKEQHHQAEQGFTTASSSGSGALSPTLSPKRPGSPMMILHQSLDKNYYMHSKALADDESDDGAAAEDRALISPSLFLERSASKTRNKFFAAAAYTASAEFKGCSAAAAKASSKGCSAAESSKGSSSKSSKSMPTDEEESYRNMDIVGFVDPVVQHATRGASAQSNNKNQQQQQQASKKPAFPGYSRIFLGSSKKAGSPTSPSGVLVYPDAVVL